MDLSPLRARLYVRGFSHSAFAAEFRQTGVVFRHPDGTARERLFALVGYCMEPQKTRSKPETWVIPNFPEWAWNHKNFARYFCQGWNRLAYASLAGTSINEGLVPAGNAATLTPGIARAIIRDLIPKRHLVSYEIRSYTMRFSGLDPEKQTRVLDAELEEITPGAVSVRYRQESLVRKGRDLKPVQTDHGYAISFAEGYVGYDRVDASDSGPFSYCANRVVFTWKHDRDAARFCDAVNRLVYEAAKNVTDDPFATFANAARTFRAGKAPAPPDGWDRHRVLAENALQEKDYFTALEHYEAGLRIFQTWPEGWFNAALLYEAVGEWDYAVDRMNRYLELTPDAPDAQAAREKLIVWKEKMRR